MEITSMDPDRVISDRAVSAEIASILRDLQEIALISICCTFSSKKTCHRGSRASTVPLMVPVYSSEISPDPHSARDVLAFVFCPPGVFVPVSEKDEIEAVALLMAPAKAEAVRRWYTAHLASLRN